MHSSKTKRLALGLAAFIALSGPFEALAANTQAYCSSDSHLNEFIAHFDRERNQVVDRISLIEQRVSATVAECASCRGNAIWAVPLAAAGVVAGGVVYKHHSRQETRWRDAAKVASDQQMLIPGSNHRAIEKARAREEIYSARASRESFKSLWGLAFAAASIASGVFLRQDYESLNTIRIVGDDQLVAEIKRSGEASVAEMKGLNLSTNDILNAGKSQLASFRQEVSYRETTMRLARERKVAGLKAGTEEYARDFVGSLRREQIFLQAAQAKLDDEMAKAKVFCKALEDARLAHQRLVGPSTSKSVDASREF